MKKYLIPMLLFISILLTACNSEEATGSTAKENSETPTSHNSTEGNTKGSTVKKPSFTAQNYPKIDGSTATIPLSEAIAIEILEMSKEETKSFIKHNTTHMAYVNLIEGNADIIFVTEPSKEELKMAEDAKIELEIIPIVKEGFVFIVNTKNSIKSLTTKQIQDIYQEKITNWKRVGGADKEIIPYQRDANSGSQTLMEQLVMKGLIMMDSPKNVVMDMSGLIDSIAKYDNAENALGYSVFYYAKAMYNKDTIKLIAVDGVMPDNKSISSGKYPFTSAYYAVIKKSDSQNAASRKLLNWILSKDGQVLAEKSGYVPMEVE